MKTIVFTLLLSLLLHAEGSSADSQARYKRFLQNPHVYKKQIAIEGKAVFEKRCAYCHGSDGSGQGGFAADLRRRISKESALHAIRNGSNNFRNDFSFGMPPMIMDKERAEIVAEYIALGMPDSHAGAVTYRSACAKCHGKNGYGYGTFASEYVGFGAKKMAPNIRNFDLATLMMILKNGKDGKIGHMQSFHYLSDEELKIVSHHVMSLSTEPDTPEP